MINNKMPNSKNKLNWLYTDGGPYILLPLKHLAYWHGVEEGSDDYNRACEVTHVGVVKVGIGQGLVFGEGENQLAWYPLGTENNEGMFVEWIAAESEDKVIKYLSSIPENVFKKEVFEFIYDDDNLKLIGAADLGDGKTWGGMEIKLMGGKYEIFTALYKPDESTELMLYKLRKTV